MIHDLPLEARTHRPIPADFETRVQAEASKHYRRILRQHRRETALAKVIAALRGGENVRTAVAVAVMLAVLAVIGIGL